MNEPNNTSTQDSSLDWTFKTEEEIEADRQALKLKSPEDTSDFLVFSEANPMFMNLSPTRRLEFFGQGNVSVGAIDFADGKVTFSGNMDESAKAFFNVLKPYIEQAFIDNKNQVIHDVNEFMNRLNEHGRG